MANYIRELRMEIDIRKKEKIEKVTEFAERMKKVQKDAGGDETIGRQRKEKSRRMKKKRQGYIEYKELSIQRNTGKETGGLIH